ncbi:MAG: hotdog fold thioesterase [Sandaracinaceae bacterium]|nr:hotdog fold thioesterase [Sandaracinaceae bacterium]
MHEASTAARLTEVRQLFLERIPFNRVLGIEIVDLSPGMALFSVPFRPELIGDPDRRALHGGVLSAVADTCGGCAVWSRIGENDRVSTIDLRIDYLRPGQPEELRCRGSVLRLGNRVGVAQITLFHPSAADTTIAEAKGVYSVKRAAA